MAGNTINVRITGLETLKRIREEVPHAADKAIQDFQRTLQLELTGRTPVGLKYQKAERNKSGARRKDIRGLGRYTLSGALKKSWRFKQTAVGRLSASTDKPYAGRLEEGKYHQVGKPRTGIVGGQRKPIAPRTVAQAGGIYSSQAVGGMAQPLLDDEKFQNKLLNLITRALKRLFR